ncbi:MULTISPECIES: Na+/H+ antiporter NhaC family protein [unclassified Halanaerobium]|uniref:Na+/H+ antiporter NhaC family protein n=1 Tax=unclassified Halanaerobium TaxID=2641197 RepID=UPI000DF25401|nr:MULTISPECIES: Na+/H+ antiporter NhaC family protein [unclassified Halanaerobium]RCW44403.1 transporter (NhaC family) [Halanaerobium sp. MA284_MarDTE_T2]RCW86540.1 transporter (NhaC family) [Halanaerobium sp. DL-01]
MDYGIWSILPPLIAIILAVATKQVFISLFLGIFSGEMIIHEWQFFISLNASLNEIVGVFAEEWITKTIIFSFLVGGLITVISASGGVRGFIEYLTEKKNLVKNKKGALLLAYVIGLVIFIESSITILVSGTVARPLTDRFNVSREKLAYVCDSTSAPVCALIPLNGWGAMLMGVIGVQVSKGFIEGNPAGILVKSIPFQFYSFFAILAVAYYIFTEKDWGPMAVAENRARETGKVLRDGATPMVSEEATSTPPKKGAENNMWNMILPMIVLIVMMPISLYITGNGNILKGSGSTSVFWAVLASISFAGFLYIVKGIMNLKEYIDYVYQGIGAIVPVAILLISAFAIGNVIGQLETGQYMASLVEGRISGGFGPAILFILSALMAFSTGTSWGTFGIMIPIGIQMAVAMGAPLYPTIGAVISGGIMGDHCSPISDTTIMASMASASDHIDHVNTQLPYALLNGVLALILYLTVGFIM